MILLRNASFAVMVLALVQAGCDSSLAFTSTAVSAEHGQTPDNSKPKPEPKELQSLIRKLKDENERKRIEAVDALADLGPAAAPAVPDLIMALRSKEPFPHGGSWMHSDRTPDAARKALIRIGKAALPALEKAMRDNDALTRVQAAWALWSIEKETNRALPVLLKDWRNRAHDEDDVCIRYDATYAIGEIAQEHPERLLPIILKVLQDDARMGDEVARVLAIMGRTDKRAVEQLFKLMSTDGEDLYRYAAFGLRELESAGVPLLIEGLTSDNAELRWRSAWALGGIQSTYAKPAIPALENCLNDNDKNVRKWSAWAIKTINE